jgi:hypothetical protein
VRITKKATAKANRSQTLPSERRGASLRRTEKKARLSKKEEKESPTDFSQFQSKTAHVPVLRRRVPEKMKKREKKRKIGGPRCRPNKTSPISLSAKKLPCGNL